MIKRRKRRRLFVLLSIVIAATILLVDIKDEKPQDAAATETEASYIQLEQKGDLRDGVYTASAEGFVDLITVEMTVKNGNISDFRVIEHNETNQLAKTAIIDLSYEIAQRRTVNVDVVSGATETSEGIIEAASDCIRQAGGNPYDY